MRSNLAEKNSSTVVDAHPASDSDHALERERACPGEPDALVSLDDLARLIVDVTCAHDPEDAFRVVARAALRIAHACSATFELDAGGEGESSTIVEALPAPMSVVSGPTVRVIYPVNATHPAWRSVRLAVTVPGDHAGDRVPAAILGSLLAILRMRLDRDGKPCDSGGSALAVREIARPTCESSGHHVTVDSGEGAGVAFNHLTAMQELTTAASAATNIDDLCRIVQQAVTRLLTVERLQIRLRLPDSGEETVLDTRPPSRGQRSDDTRPDPGASVSVPLLADGEPVGMLIAHVDNDLLLSQADELMRSVSQSVSGAFERQLLLDQIARQTRHEAGLRLIAERINGTLDTEELMQIASDVVFNTIECDLVLVSIMDRATNRMRYISYRTDLHDYTPQPIGYVMHEDSLSFDAIQRMCQIVVTDAGESGYSTFTVPPWSNFGSAIATPMSIDDERVGVIVLGRGDRSGFLETDLSLQRQIATMIATALENTTAYAKHLRHTGDLGKLHRLAANIASQLDLQKSLDEIVHAARTLVAADGSAVGILDGDEIMLLGSTGSVAGKLQPRIPARDAIVKAAGGNPELIAINDLQDADAGRFGRIHSVTGARAFVFVPLIGPEGVTGGGIAVFSNEPRVWTERDKSLLTTLGSASAMAIQNARHFEGTRNLLRASVESLAAAVEAKDPYARDHSRHVARYARLIAEELKLEVDAVGEIELAALLHDVGKIGIPDTVLENPERLDSAGWAAMHLHPAIGEQILSGNPILQPLLPMVRHHHERWDGHGYPDRLAGDAIPVGSAIIAVAEAVDTITSDRPYQHARSWHDAVVEIESGRGEQFAPYAVDAFLSAHRRGLFAEDEARIGPQAEDRALQDGRRAPALDVRALRIFEEVAREIRAGADLRTFLTNTVDALWEILDIPHVAIYVRTTSDEDVELIAAKPPIPHRAKLERQIRAGLGMIGWVARHGVLQNIPDVSRDSRYLDGGFESGERSELCVPLFAEGQVIGVINLEADRLDAFTASDELLLTSTADHIASAIQVMHLHEQLKNLSSTDSLTGLHNHRSFFNHLVVESERATASQSLLSIAIVDVNDLKAINDSYGHLAGDAALRAVADKLRRLKHTSDVICRYGGDEFALILPGTPAEGAFRMMESIARELRSGSFEVDGMSLPLPEAAWGIATAPDDGYRPMELLSIADGRMYLQKDVSRHSRP